MAIRTKPMTAGRSGVCLKKKIPLMVMSAIPSADQVAYAMPMGTVRRQRLNR